MHSHNFVKFVQVSMNKIKVNKFVSPFTNMD